MDQIISELADKAMGYACPVVTIFIVLVIIWLALVANPTQAVAIPTSKEDKKDEPESDEDGD